MTTVSKLRMMLQVAPVGSKADVGHIEVVDPQGRFVFRVTRNNQGESILIAKDDLTTNIIRGLLQQEPQVTPDKEAARKDPLTMLKDLGRTLEKAGILEKYRVQRLDGKDAPGEKHHGCWYYVLDATHDPYAIPAMRAYANACEREYPELAKGLRQKADWYEALWEASRDAH